ncbi:MAG TPA: acyl-CoA dehydrogenase family protein [Myxococcota bacterium]|nr:acyl-CoA dehydrogenase family protein [Myxococcota bacterium]
MRFAFTEEQEELRATARAFLAERSSSERVRAAADSESGFDAETWKRIGGELGWTAVAIPEEHGGLGLGAVEICALLEPMGESLLCAPFFASVCLGAQVILEAGTPEQKDAWLPAIAAGERIATLAFDGPDGGEPGVLARTAGSDFVLSGTVAQVVDGCAADLVVVVARASDGALALFAVPGDARGLERRALPTLDRTRRLAALALRDVRVPATARLGGAEAHGAAALERTLDRARIALAAEQVGGAQRCLDLAVAYAKERVQFGRPIGSFQAIKHRLAEMMVRVETARSAAWWASGVAALGDADEIARVASLAKAWSSEAFFHAAAECLQVHGGVGFTAEYDVHLYLKRARAGEAWLGDPAWHRERIAGALGLGV